MKEPLVSILCTTFNHEKYIEECLAGFVMQNCNFAFEVIIHDDASSDKTPEIINKYYNEYPDIIKPILQIENQWSKGVRITTKYNLPRAKGKYIALCEGDDCWTSNNKLQLQVDFLEKNQKYSMSFHDVKIASDFSSIVKQFYKPQKDTLYFRDILFKHYIPTCSLVFRKSMLEDPLPKWFDNAIVGDIPLELILANKGPAKYFNIPMGIYRKHSGGLTMDKSRAKLVRSGFINLYKNLNKHFKYKYWVYFNLLIIKHQIGKLKDKFI